MAKGRQLKGRIRSVQNTRKITRTMELVSTSKLKRAQDRMVAARPYAEALREVLADEGRLALTYTGLEIPDGERFVGETYPIDGEMVTIDAAYSSQTTQLTDPSRT